MMRTARFALCEISAGPGDCPEDSMKYECGISRWRQSYIFVSPTSNQLLLLFENLSGDYARRVALHVKEP